ncbi:DUF3800 domain-containing protein [Pseudodonghicola sp.]|uniref:DUF3800 domain-containing protein n=1 Tax=Pseudodonghicola sp. TaxID=1969463 RepID=UPI003A9708F5
MSFTVYVDESGEAGIVKVRDGLKPGASRYFVLGAMVAQDAAKIRAKEVLGEVRKTISKKKWKHATELDHASKVLLAREMSKLHVRYFAVISNKVTLGGYKDFIDADPQKYYNKCLCYLLEKVCSYLARFNVTENDVRVVLEERNHNYDTMLRYLMTVRDKPIYPQSRSLKLLNPFSIVAVKKGEDDCLEFADFVSHAVYLCANKTQNNYFIPEPRYFSEISKRFAGDDRGRILGVGLKCIHDLTSLELDDDIQALFKNSRAQLPKQQP